MSNANMEEYIQKQRVRISNKGPSIATALQDRLGKNPLEQSPVKTLTTNISQLSGMFSLLEDVKLAESIWNNYLNEYSISSTADLSTLKQIIFLEVFLANSVMVKINLARIHGDMVPTELLDSLHRCNKDIASLKGDLGVKNDAKEASDGFKALLAMKQKAKKWRENNQASRTFTCPHCSSPVLTKIRMDRWEAQKHPFFKDKVLRNEHALLLYGSGKISLLDVSKILDPSSNSTDYVTWIISKLSKEDKKKFKLLNKKQK